MVRLFREEIREELEKAKEQEQSPGAEGRRVTVATGRLAAPILQEAARAVEAQYPEVRVQVLAVENRFFGERITVAGLLTGRDLKEQLSGRELVDALLLTENMFRDGTEAFLDDMTAGELSGALQVPITIVKSDGKAFLEAVLGLEKEEKPKTAGTEHRGKQPYEHRP